MTSMRSWLNPTIIKENFKRFWPVAAIGFFIWFLSMPFILIAGDNYFPGTISDMMSHTNFATFSMDLAIPISMAILCFSYLHRGNSAGVMHSMPCTRMSLYVSSWISGFVLTVVPVILTAAVLLVIKRPVIENGHDLFTAAAIMKWLAEEIVVSLFVYSVAVLAGMVAGNTVLHGLTALAFNFLLPVLYAIYMAFGDLYLYGVDFESMGAPIKNLSPYIMLITSRNLPADKSVMFIVVSIAVTIAGYLLYRVRPLERTGDSYVFKAATWIIGVLIIYIFGCLSGFLFHYELGITSYGIGILLGWGIGQMIVNKTTKIFRKDCLAAGLAGIIAIAGIIGCFKADILGYEDYLPKASEVSQISFDCSKLNFNLVKEGRYFTEESDLEDIIGFHKELLDNKKSLKQSLETGFEGESCYVNIKYKLKNGKEVSRYMYSLPVKYLRESRSLEHLWYNNSKRADYGWLLDAPVEDMYVEMDYYDSDNPHWINLDYGRDNAELKDKIRQAAVKDVSDGAFNTMMTDGYPCGYLRLQVRTPAPKDSKNYDEYYSEGYHEYFEPVSTSDTAPYVSDRYLVRSIYIEYSKSYESLMDLVPEIENYSEVRFVEK